MASLRALTWLAHDRLGRKRDGDDDLRDSRLEPALLHVRAASAARRRAAARCLAVGAHALVQHGQADHGAHAEAFAAVLDVATSLQHQRGYIERNPFVPSQPVPFVALKASLTTATAIAAWKMRKQHPRLAVLVLVAGATTGTYAAVHNARLK